MDLDSKFHEASLLYDWVKKSIVLILGTSAPHILAACTVVVQPRSAL